MGKSSYDIEHEEGYREGFADGQAGAAAALKAAEDRSCETQMLAFKWMEAHDKLKAGKPYSFPKPADVPEAIARTAKATADLAAARAENDRLVEHLRSIRHEYETSGQLSGAMLYRTTALLAGKAP